MTEKTTRSGQADALRRRAAERAVQAVENHDMLSAGADQRVLHELRLHQIALEMQNEQLRRAQESLQASLAEKEVHLMEARHRIKNNLAAIVAMIEMQRQTQGGTASTALLELGGRIRSMALVYENLYQSGNLISINFQKYIEKLIRELRAMPGVHSRIRCRAAADIELSLDIAVSCGMIVNELIGNAFKHAFPGAAPQPGAGCCEINVSMEWDGCTYTLIVGDNGVGLPAGLDWTKTKSFGLRLVKMLGQRQLRGEISVDSTHGTCFMLRFSPGQRKSKEDR